MKVLLLGAGGQLGRELVGSLRRARVGSPGGELVGSLGRELEVKAATRGDVDVGDFDALAKALEDVSVVVNAAAFTDVDAAEDRSEVATRINGEAVAFMGSVCRERRAALVHLSTDQVFDGHATRPYREDDEPAPLNVYGRSKLMAERALADMDAPAIVLRSAWLYGGIDGGRSFVSRILEQARAGEPLRVVRDQIGSPTFARDLAELIARLIGDLGADPHARASELRGIYHAAGTGAASRVELARAALDLAGYDPAIEPVAAYPQRARRPQYSVLDCDKLHRTFGLRLPPWRDALARALASR